MRLTGTESMLMECMSQMRIIDAHEHLPPEHVRLASPQDVFTLVSGYARHDLFSAGMDRDVLDFRQFKVPRPEYDRLFDHSVPLAERWAAFRPYWRVIRHGSYARAAILTARMVYDVPDIGDDTFELLSERIAAANVPGLYERILVRQCGIDACLTMAEPENCAAPLVPVVPMSRFLHLASAEAIQELAGPVGLAIAGLGDYEEMLRRYLDRAAAAGARGIKIIIRPLPRCDRAGAEKCLRLILAGRPLPAAESQVNYWGESLSSLGNYLVDFMCDLAGERGLVVAVHTGMWGDFRVVDCRHMLDLAPRHPATTFDLFHLGMPDVRSAIVVAKNLPNVHLNLCWSHVISQAQACSAIDELLDQVPVNKVIAFGGDYQKSVEKVVGHLHMARENLARVFGARIDRGTMDRHDALEILRLWFRENPCSIYSLDEARETMGPVVEAPA